MRGIEFLRNQLSAKRGRINLRYLHYEMKHLAKDFKISTPPDLTKWMSVLGWCAKSVDALADRLSFDRFDNDLFGMNEIYADNNRDIMVDSAILSALIAACSFTYITADETGRPLMRALCGYEATGIIDPVTDMLKEGYAILETDIVTGLPTMEAYLVPFRTDIYINGEYSSSYKHSAPYPLLVPMIYRPDSKRPFGHSRISRSCMDIVDSAVRTIKRSEIAAEFYSYPQKYILGMDPDAEQMDKWRATMSSLLRIDKDDDGDKPTVGQFQMAAQTPHTDQLRVFAGLFAGETGLTLDDLGFPSQNPSSSEAIKASHESMRLTARKAQKTFGVGLLNAGYLAACVRDNESYPRYRVSNTIPKWLPLFEPDVSAIAGIGDAVMKIQTTFPDYFDEGKMRELTGI